MAAIPGYGVTLLFNNLAKTTLAGPVTNVATTAQLATGTGALYPNPGAGQGYIGTFVDAATGLLNEVVLVTGMSGDQITAMTRAQESTTALNWNTGDFFYMFCTAGTMASMSQSQQLTPARVVTANTSFLCSNNDGAIGLAPTSPGPFTVTLPVTPSNGQIISIEDLIGFFQADNINVAPNAGQNIAGLPANALLNVNRQCGIFRYYSSNSTWSFKS